MLCPGGLLHQRPAHDTELSGAERIFPPGHRRADLPGSAPVRGQPVRDEGGLRPHEGTAGQHRVRMIS